MCGICQNGFANEILLEEHKREHPTCPICFSKLLSRAHYKDHIEEHPNCGHCGVKVAGNVELENHLLEHVIPNTQNTQGRMVERQTVEKGSEMKDTLGRSVNQTLGEEKEATPNKQTCSTGAGVEVKRIHSVLSLANPELEVELVAQMSPAPILTEEEQDAYAQPTFNDSLKVHSDHSSQDKIYPLSLGGPPMEVLQASLSCQSNASSAVKPFHQWRSCLTTSLKSTQMLKRILPTE